jgi:hypothetical protein
MFKLGIVKSRYQYKLQINLQNHANVISFSFQDPPFVRYYIQFIRSFEL